jgi:MFS family permease
MPMPPSPAGAQPPPPDAHPASAPAPTPPAAHADAPAPPDSPDPGRRQFLLLFTAVMLPMFLAAVDQTLLATATPHIAAELGGLADTSWIAVGYLLAATVMAPMYGRLGDRLGRRRVLLVALAVFALGSLACMAAPAMGWLVAARMLQGLGGGGLMVLSQALIGEVVPPRHRPRYQGWFALVFTSSSVGGPVLGGLVVSHVSWRWLFLAQLPLCALAAWRVARLPDPPRAGLHDAPMEPPGRPKVPCPPRGAGRAQPGPGGSPMDLAGALLFAATACSALLWFSFVGHRFDLVSPASAVLLGLALTGGTLLWRQQRRHAAPFLPLDIVRLPGAGWICATVLCFAAALFALVFLVPIYLQAGHGASAAGAGLQLLPLTGGLVVGAVINGRVTARSGSIGRLPPYGLALAALALLLLAVLPPSRWGFTVVALAGGLGLGTVMPNAQLAIQVLAGRARLGAAAALVSLTRSSGAALGTAAFSGLAFVLLHVGRGPAGISLAALDPAQVTHAFHVVFGALAAFVALGAWAATRVPVIHLAQTEPPGAAGDGVA